jgi:hypothetical protein
MFDREFCRDVMVNLVSVALVVGLYVALVHGFGLRVGKAGRAAVDVAT